MALPKEPRQKMINLMYIVLTALLALNVSSEILNAFKTVNNSLLTANGTIDQKNMQIFRSFQQKLNDPTTAERARIWYPKADVAGKMSDSMITYIDKLKMDVLNAAGYNPKDGTYKEDDLEASTHVMSDPGTKGEELRQKLTAFKNNILAIDPQIAAQFTKELPIDLSMPKTNNRSSKNSWSSAYFNMTPTIAAITILSKFQNDVKNSEAMVVDFCHRKVGEVQLVYDVFSAFAGTNSQYLMPGQELQITAGVGAFSKAAQPTISIDGAPVQLNDSGYATYKTTVSSPGNYTKRVKITFKKPDGTISEVDKDVPYTVGLPTGASVSADAVKVLYIGLQNPLTISAGNVGAERVKASIDNGSLSTGPQPGKWISEPRTPGKANITVYVDGKPLPAPFEFRVKTVPDPDAMVGASGGGTMGVNDFKAQAGVRAELDNFVFEGVQFTVTSFTMVFTGAGFPELQYRQVNGNRFDNVRDLIEHCKPGTTVTIDEIHASGPGGSRKLTPIVFNLHG
ncbi:MAG: gliding motility protein GldM [Chitinophagaceae bacterium]